MAGVVVGAAEDVVGAVVVVGAAVVVVVVVVVVMSRVWPAHPVGMVRLVAGHGEQRMLPLTGVEW